MRPHATPPLDRTIALRFERYGPEIETSLRAVYGERAAEVMDRVVALIDAGYAERPGALRRLDEARLLHPDWLQSPEQIGYVAYADRYAGTLLGVGEHLDHLVDLGVTYLHLMPLLKPRPGANDGGYAVMDYGAVREDLGTMDDLKELAAELRERDISLVLDLVLNHVAREHEWAVRARAGEQKYRDYFHFFPDRTEPDEFEKTLPEVFPEFAPGNFTWDDDAGAWVWTTFNSYQWDLNWANPDVLCEFLQIIIDLVNAGVEVIRLDAIAFLWKRLGTICQGEPEVHHLTQALRASLRIIAPAAAFKAEAIVGPEQLLPYLGKGDHWGKVSDMAYHNSLMVQWWSAIASRDTGLFVAALRGFPPKPTSATWATYVRCHDDIGWAVSDLDAQVAGLGGPQHRAFLSEFYSGVFPGSFAKGLVFQENPVTHERRISGTCASLAGLQLALDMEDEPRIDDAIARILLLHTAILGFGGVPLLYMGDEIGMLNDYSYAEEPEHASDNRWAHRPRMDWDAVAAAKDDPHSVAGRILTGITQAIAVRRALPHLHASVETVPLDSPDERLLLLLREHPRGRMVQVYNVSEEPADLPSYELREHLGWAAEEVLSGYEYSFMPEEITVEPYEALWFIEEPSRR